MIRKLERSLGRSYQRTLFSESDVYVDAEVGKALENSITWQKKGPCGHVYDKNSYQTLTHFAWA